MGWPKVTWIVYTFTGSHPRYVFFVRSDRPWQAIYSSCTECLRDPQLRITTESLSIHRVNTLTIPCHTSHLLPIISLFLSSPLRKVETYFFWFSRLLLRFSTTYTILVKLLEHSIGQKFSNLLLCFWRLPVEIWTLKSSFETSGRV